MKKVSDPDLAGQKLTDPTGSSSLIFGELNDTVFLTFILQ